jgi:phage-related protein
MPLKQVRFNTPALAEIRGWPSDAKREFGATLHRLQKGEAVGMPDARAMPSVAKGVFEIRVATAAGAFRSFYVSVNKGELLVFHAFIKKTQKTPQIEIETGRRRLKTFLLEMK